MNATDKKPSLGKLGSARPRTAAAVQSSVKRSLLAPDRPLPLVIEPRWRGPSALRARRSEGSF